MRLGRSWNSHLILMQMKDDAITLQNWQFVKVLNMHLSCDPTISLHPRPMEILQNYFYKNAYSILINKKPKLKTTHKIMNRRMVKTYCHVQLKKTTKKTTHQ